MPAVYLYTHTALRPIVREVLGTNALHWYDTNYSICAATPKTCMHYDAEFPDGILQRELPLAIRTASLSTHNGSQSSSRNLRIVDSPNDADVVLWLVWDYAFCLASGVVPLAWERGKGRLTASCTAHVAMMRWLTRTPRWQRMNGRDFAFIVDDGRRWQEALGKGVHIPWFTAIARERYAGLNRIGYSSSSSTMTGGSDAADMDEAASTLFRIMRNSIIFSTEDRRRADDRGHSRVIVMPYYTSPTYHHRRVAIASRPTLASFIGTLEVHDDCAACENGIPPRDIRVKLADELSSGCEQTTDEDGVLHRCKLVALDTTSIHRDDRTALGATGIKFANVLRESIFCMIPRGDSASTKRFYAAIQAGCVPVVISDQFIPAFADRRIGGVDVRDAFIQIAEADFLAPTFSMIRFLQLTLRHGVERLVASGRRLRVAFSYQHARGSRGIGKGNLGRAQEHDAVDSLVAQLVETLKSGKAAMVSQGRSIARPTLYDAARVSRTAHPYMIFADERTGSTSLCWALDNHPQLKCDHELLKNDWVCSKLMAHVGAHGASTPASKEGRLPTPGAGACDAVMADLGGIMQQYWARCPYDACGGKVFPANLPRPHTVHEFFRNSYAFGARVVKLVRLDKQAQYSSRAAARTSGEWGSTPSLRASRGGSGRARHSLDLSSPKERAKFKRFELEQLAWQRQVEELRPTRHFLRIFTEELVGGGRLNLTTLNRVAVHLGASPYPKDVYEAMVKAQATGKGITWKRFFKNASGVGV